MDAPGSSNLHYSALEADISKNNPKPQPLLPDAYLSLATIDQRPKSKFLCIDFGTALLKERRLQQHELNRSVTI